MIRRALLTALAICALGLSAPAVFAQDNPLVPSYKDAASKKYIMEFCNIDKDSDGFISAAEFVNKGNPLSPGWEGNPRFAKKYQEWKDMCPPGMDKVTMEQFMAYRDTQNPLSPNFKKK